MGSPQDEAEKHGQEISEELNSPPTPLKGGLFCAQFIPPLGGRGLVTGGKNI